MKLLLKIRDNCFADLNVILNGQDISNKRQNTMCGIKKTESGNPASKKTSFGRMFHCTPMAGDKFYLRLLWTVMKSFRSFEHIRTVNGVVHDTNRTACVVLGLTVSDKEWIDTFTEAVVLHRASFCGDYWSPH